VPWQALQFLQPDDFKSLSAAQKEKLKQSILRNEFSQPFYVWQPCETMYCLDGFHRVSLLHELLQEGHEVPELLPATFVDCNDKQEAARLVLQYSSIYAKVTESGMLDFMEAFDLSFDDVSMTIDLPDFSMDTFVARATQDFSGKNAELDLDAFTDEITMKLIFPKAEYLDIKERMTRIMESNGYDKPEQLIKTLVFAHEV
jgi:hypothetical protein